MSSGAVRAPRHILEERVAGIRDDAVGRAPRLHPDRGGKSGHPRLIFIRDHEMVVVSTDLH
jgi:hypothetical protein